MNLNKIRPKKETEDLVLSITKIFENVIKQTHTQRQEKLEFTLTRSRETFQFNPSINLGLDSNWMIGLITLGVYNSFFNLTEENNNFELYTDTFDQFSFSELKDELEKILKFSDITPYHL